MSDTTIDDDTTTGNEDNLRHLRERAAAASTAEAERDRAKREAMFLRAGIDVDSDDPRHAKLAKMLFTSFEGNDVEALKAEAREIGLLDAAPPAADDDTARQQEQYRRDLAQGRTPDAREQQQTADPYATAFKEFHDIRQKGGQVEDARVAAFGAVFGAANQGDKRVLLDPQEWAKEQARHGSGQRLGR